MSDAEPLEWESVVTHGPIPKDRHAHLSCVHNGRLFIVGGRANKTNQAYADVHILNLCEDWPCTLCLRLFILETLVACARETFTFDTLSSCPSITPCPFASANSFWEIGRTTGEGPVDTSLYSAERINNMLVLIGSDFRKTFETILFLVPGTFPNLSVRGLVCECVWVFVCARKMLLLLLLAQRREQKIVKIFPYQNPTFVWPKLVSRLRLAHRSKFALSLFLSFVCVCV